MKTHPFDRYFRKHNHYPRLRFDNGHQKLIVEFAPGYVRIQTFPRGGQIYILRSTWFNLLRRAVPLTRKWSHHPDFDVPLADHQSFQAEILHLDDLRRAKKGRRTSAIDDFERRERQRRRFLAARARRLRQESAQASEDDTD